MLGDKVIQEVVGINTVVEDGDELALEEHVKSIRCYHEELLCTATKGHVMTIRPLRLL